MWGISWLIEKVLVYQEGLCCLEVAYEWLLSHTFETLLSFIAKGFLFLILSVHLDILTNTKLFNNWCLTVGLSHCSAATEISTYLGEFRFSVALSLSLTILCRAISIRTDFSNHKTSSGVRAWFGIEIASPGPFGFLFYIRMCFNVWYGFFSALAYVWMEVAKNIFGYVRILFADLFLIEFRRESLKVNKSWVPYNIQY